MTEILFTVIVLAMLAFLVIRERDHAQQIKELNYIIKSSYPEEYNLWKGQVDKPAEEEEGMTEIEARDMTPEDIKKMKVV